MTSNVTIEVHQGIDGSAVFGDLIAAAGDLSPLMQKIEPVLLDSVHRNFATESNPQRGPWAELKSSTEKSRQRKGYSPAHPILIASGAFFNSIIAQSGPNFAEVGSGLSPYPVFLVQGTRKMPARSPFGLTVADESEIYNLLGAYLLP